MKRTSTRCRARSGPIATLAALALWLATGSVAAEAGDDDPVLARVNGHEILRSDAFASIETLPLGDQINMRKRMDLVVRSLVNEELLFQSVLSPTSTPDRDLRREIKALVVERVIRRYVKDRIAVDDRAIRDYYRAHRDTLRGWHVRARHIRLRSRPECEEMLARIDSEEAFAALAKAHSLDRVSAEKGGDLGYLMYSPNRPRSLGFEDEIFEMALGETRIFDSERGCHLIRVVEIDDPPDPPFDRIRAFLKPRLESLMERELLQSLLERVSRDARVELVPP